MAGDSAEPGNLSLYKWLTFGSMYLGYTFAVVNRKCFSFALPSIISTLHLDKNDVGLVSSSQNLAYTISKFCGGVLSDNISAKMMFAVGLFLSGILTISLTAFQSATAFAILWFLQGLVQGGGWPACAKIMKQWFRTSEFGTWYSILNTTMNLACSAGPLITALITARSSWQTAVFVYGLLSVLISLLCYVTMWNSPADVGVAAYTGAANDANKSGDQGQTRQKGRGTWSDMLRSPLMWLVSSSYLVVFLGRTAVLDWAQLYLVQDLKHDAYVGSMFISSLEVGGIIGSVTAGFVADRLVAMTHREDVYGSPRLTVSTIFVAVNIVGLHALTFVVGENTSQILILVVGFTIGFGIYGPVSLYGIMAIEAAPTHLSGTSHAIVSLASNVGAILAGLPFSYFAKYYEWQGSFILLETLLITILVTKILMRNVEYKMVLTKKKLQ